MGLLGTVLALWIQNVVELALYAYRLFVPGIVPQVVAAFYWSGAKPRPVTLSMAIGPTTTLVLTILLPGTMLTYFDPVGAGLLVSLVVLVGGSLLFGGREAPAPPLMETASEG